MRLHITAACYVFFFAARLDLSRTQWACLFLTVGSVFAAELFNTAVEKLCDFSEKHLNPHIRVIKDIAAGAVLLCSVFAALVGAVIFLRQTFWDTLLDLVCHPVSLLLLVFSAVVAVLFVVLGPQGIRDKLRLK